MSIISALRTAGIAAALAGGLAGCATISVSSDVNAPLVHTVQCHTFAWAGSFRGGPLTATLANPVNEARLRDAIASHLQSLGIRPASGGADCLVGYGIGIHNVIAGAYPVGWGWGWGWGWGPWWDGPMVFPEAIVGVDLYDAHGGQPLWHAAAREDLSALRGPKAGQGIDAAVAAIFTKYPG